MKTKFLLAIATVLLFSSCASYTITKESLIQQLGGFDNVSKISSVASAGVKYNSNKLTKVNCKNKKGEDVTVFIDKNVMLKTTNNIGISSSLLFDTIFIKNDTLFGLKSRFLGVEKQISMKEVVKFEIVKDN